MSDGWVVSWKSLEALKQHSRELFCCIKHEFSQFRASCRSLTFSSFFNKEINKQKHCKAISFCGCQVWNSSTSTSNMTVDWNSSLQLNDAFNYMDLLCLLSKKLQLSSCRQHCFLTRALSLLFFMCWYYESRPACNLWGDEVWRSRKNESADGMFHIFTVNLTLLLFTPAKSCFKQSLMH